MPNMYSLCKDGMALGHIYGEPRDAMALFMGDISGYETEDEAVAAWEAEHGVTEPSDIEMGFDPYAGCYTDDC